VYVYLIADPFVRAHCLNS